MFFCEGEPSVYKGHLFGVSPYGLYVVAYNNDGTLVVQLVQHRIHIALKVSVHIRVRLVKHQYVGLGHDGARQQYTLQLPSA